jgi:hypothetical protein
MGAISSHGVSYKVQPVTSVAGVADELPEQLAVEIPRLAEIVRFDVFDHPLESRLRFAPVALLRRGQFHDVSVRRQG